MGQGLFFKIFTWFWLTVILAGVSIEVTGAVARRQARVSDRGIEKVLPEAARSAAERLERSDASSLAEFLSRLQQSENVVAFFFDERGDELTRRWAPPAVRKQALRALQEAGIQRGGDRGEIAAVRVPGSGGHPYAMAFVLQSGSIVGYRVLFPYLRLIVIILVSGVFCFLIARHVTRPLERLQAAAARIAEGRLDTRVSPDLQRRGDEIATLAKDFNRMAARIEALVHGHKELLANVSHELRSPLARLLVSLSLAARAPQEGTPEHLDRIRAEAGRLDKLIGQLLVLSRIDSTVDATQRAAIDLSALVQDVADDAVFEGAAHARRVTVSADPACTVHGDEDALRSALENIVRNAIRYTPENAAVEISLRCESSRVVIQVRDHGPGVSDDMLRGIFAPFCRAEDSTEGFGLGLAIAERAVVAHLGSIRASNAEGGGLLVEMDLPMAGRACSVV
jgi:two-component system sensor histidine kinase CpxA